MKTTISAVATLLAAATSVVARDCIVGNEYCAESLMFLDFAKYIGPVAIEIVKHGNFSFDHLKYSNLTSLEEEIFTQLQDPFRKSKFVCMPHDTVVYTETCNFGCAGVEATDESDYCLASASPTED